MMLLNKIKISTAFKILLFISFLFFSFVSKNLTFADTSTPDTSLTIVKYKLSESQLQNSNLPKHPTGSILGANEAKDSSGNDLTIMSGVQYQIDEVIPSNDENVPFEIAPNNHSQVITTDGEGQATITLPAGIYRVTELQGAGIQNPAAPVIVQLPMTLQNGQILNHVYLYPKSSVISPQKETTSSRAKEISNIPQTSGSESSLYPIYIALFIVICAGLYGLFIIKSKHYTK